VIWTHPAAIVDHPLLTLVAGFDPHQPTCKSFGQAWGAAAARDWQDLVGYELDCLLIAAPTATHAQYLEASLVAQIPIVVCEKPLTGNLNSTRRLVASFQAAQRQLRIYYPRRWISDLEELRLRIVAGEFGALRTFSAYYGNGLRNVGCHLIELILRLLGTIERVAARSSSFGDYANDDPTPHLWLQLGNGVDGLMQAYEYSDYAMVELDMLFEQSRIRLTDLGFRLECWKSAPSLRYTGYRELTLERSDHTDYGEAARRFWRYVRDQNDPKAPMVDDWELAIAAVVEAGIESLSSGKEVNVSASD
jgi:predicted dehydrogenase